MAHIRCLWFVLLAQLGLSRFDTWCEYLACSYAQYCVLVGVTFVLEVTVVPLYKRNRLDLNIPDKYSQTGIKHYTDECRQRDIDKERPELKKM